MTMEQVNETKQNFTETLIAVLALTVLVTLSGCGHDAAADPKRFSDLKCTGVDKRFADVMRTQKQTIAKLRWDNATQAQIDRAYATIQQTMTDYDECMRLEKRIGAK